MTTYHVSEHSNKNSRYNSRRLLKMKRYLKTELRRQKSDNSEKKKQN